MRLSNVERLILVLATGAVFLATHFHVREPLGLLLWVGLGLALTFLPAFALSLLHAFVVSRLPSGMNGAVRRLLSILIGGGCVVLIPILSRWPRRSIRPRASAACSRSHWGSPTARSRSCHTRSPRRAGRTSA